MLEDLALEFSETPEDVMRLINFGLLILGGVIGSFTHRSIKELKRAPYFAFSSMIFLAMAAVTFGGTIFIVESLAAGFFWVVVAAEMLTSVVGGFFIARIAADRSRDAYGHSKGTVLAFIPLANFWLLLTPTKNKMSANGTPTIPLLTGGLGVLSGIIMLCAGVSISAYSQVEGTRRVQEASAAGVFNEVMLDRTLALMAAEVQTPLAVDEATTLVRIEALGRELRYVYEVDADVDFLPMDLRLGLTQQNCSFEGLTGVIDAGAILRHVYLRMDGSEIGVVEVTRQACGR